MPQLEFRAMGCRMLAVLDSNDDRASAALAEVPRRFEAWEQCLSRFRETSELVSLNRQTGRPVPVSETLCQVTRQALYAAVQTDGLVTPTVLDALEAAGYDHSLSDPVPPPAVSLPNVVQRTAAGRVLDWRLVQLDPRRRTVTVPRGLRLDLAGVAKGWAAEQAAARLASIGPALVEASGDIAITGPRADGSPWPIGIENPFGPNEDLPLLMLSNEAVATSTRGYRRWQRDGKWQHHIIDPRTGAPAETDVFSATVVAPTAVQAEAAAKAVLILGSRAGQEWIEARPQLASLLVLDNGSVLASSRLYQHTWEGITQ